MVRETFGRPAARFPLRWSRGERVGKEIVQWSPSRWTAAKIVLYLKHMRNHLLHMPPDGTYEKAGVTSAVMSVDIALSELAMIHSKCLRVIEAKPGARGVKETIILPLGDGK